jgi:hypothetical protein
MNTFERALIEPSLIRVLARGDQTAMALTQYLDPIALVIGMSLWGTRVYGVRSAHMRLAKQGYTNVAPASEPTVLQTESPTASYNGYSDDALTQAIQGMSIE